MPQKPQQKVITARYYIELSECKRELDLSLEWIYKALPQPDLILWGVWEFVVSAVTHKGKKKPQLSLLTLNFVSVVRSAHEHFFSQHEIYSFTTTITSSRNQLVLSAKK